MDCSTLVLRGHWRVRGLGLEEGGRVLLSRAHRLSARAPFFLESESRENSRFSIGDFTCRLFCGQHCCDIVSNCCNIVPANLLRIYPSSINLTSRLNAVVCGRCAALLTLCLGSMGSGDQQSYEIF